MYGPNNLIMSRLHYKVLNIKLKTKIIIKILLVYACHLQMLNNFVFKKQFSMLIPYIYPVQRSCVMFLNKHVFTVLG